MDFLFPEPRLNLVTPSMNRTANDQPNNQATQIKKGMLGSMPF